MFSRMVRLVIGAIVVYLMTTGCASRSSPVPGHLYFLSDDRLTVVANSNHRTLSLPSQFHSISISPRGRLLAGLEEDKQGRSLSLISVEKGSEVTRIQAASRSPITAWSSKDDRLAVAWNEEGLKSITVLDLEASSNYTIPFHTTPVTRMAWSPDGKWLAVEAGPQLSSDREVWLIHTITRTVSRVADHAEFPIWSPDGTSLVFTSWDSSGATQLVAQDMSGNQRILVNASSLSNGLEIASHLFDKNVLQIYWVGWSPNTDSLAVTFKAAGEDPRFALVTITPTGRPLAGWVLPVYPQAGMYPPLPCNPFDVHWTTEQGRIVVQTGGPGCKGRIALLDAKDLSKVQEIRVPTDSGVHISPDGTWVAVQSGSGSWELSQLMPTNKKVPVSAKGKLVLWTDTTPS